MTVKLMEFLTDVGERVIGPIEIWLMWKKWSKGGR